MNVGYRASTAVEDAVAAGLRGLGLEPAEPVADGPTVVAGTPGDELFATVDRQATTPWIAVEIGGIGGQSLEEVAGAVSVLDPHGPCYACLKSRVDAATASSPDSSSHHRDVRGRFAGAIAGQILRTQAQLDLEAVVGTVTRVNGDDHRLLPVPGCRCGDDSGRFDTPEPSEPSGESLDRAEVAVDSLMGPITQVGEQSSYPAPYYIAELADSTAMSEVQVARYAAGVDLDWDDAFMRALGEGLERYCAGMYRLESLPSDKSDSYVPLSELPTAHEDAEAIGRWWPGIDLLTDEAVHLPVEAVTFPPPDSADIDAITTGLGLGATRTDAILAGLTEVLERDACMLGWYSTFEPLELSVDTESYRTLVRRLAGEGLATTSIVVTQDIDIPVVTSIVHRRDSDGQPVLETPFTDPDDWPAFAVGSAAAIEPAVAAERSLAEATQNWVELREMGPEEAAEEGAIGDFASFPRQARLVLETGPTVDARDIAPETGDSPETALEYIREQLRETGLSAYVARTTTRDVAALGFEAVRVIVPDTQPLVHRRAHFTDRLRQVPRSLGFQPRLDQGDHPYP